MSQFASFLEQLRSDLYVMWQRRWSGFVVATVIAAIGAVALIVARDRYEASAKIYVDTQTVLKPLMAGLAFQPDIDQQVRMLARTLISHPTVEKIMKAPEVGLEQPPEARYALEVEQLKDRIKLVPSGAGNLYSISYRDTNAERAQRLVEKLVNVFMQSNVTAKQSDSAEASRFIDTQIKVYEAKLTEAENRLKDFKLRNFGVTGVANQDYFARVSSLSDEVGKLRLELSAAEQSRDALRRELSQEDPQLPPESMPANGGALVSETEARLDAQKRALDDLLRRYTEQHPDVIAVRRTIAQLETQRKIDLEGRKGRGNAATNPVFQQLRISLASAEANVASLRSQLGLQQTRLEQTRAMATRVPQVEAEFAQLNRDYDVIRKNYEQLVSRREAASLGEKIDQTSGLTDFRVVDPPQVAPAPVFPGRRFLAVIVFLAAVAGGVAATYLMARFVHTVVDTKSLAELTRRPVLGTVSLLMNDKSRSQNRKQRLSFAGALGAFLVANAAWMAWVAVSSRV